MNRPHRLKSALGAGHALERELEAGGSIRIFLVMHTAARRRRGPHNVFRSAGEVG